VRPALSAGLNKPPCLSACNELKNKFVDLDNFRVVSVTYTIQISNPVSSKRIPLFLQNVQNASEAHSISYSVGTGGSYPAVIWPG